MLRATPVDDIHAGLIEALKAFRTLVASLPTEAPGQGRVTAEQLTLLVHLRDRDPVTMGEVAASRAIALNTATALVERLVAQGLVERRADGADRRIVRVTLTGQGTALVRAVMAIRRQRLRALLDTLPADELEALSAATPVIVKLAEQARLRAQQ